MGKICSVGGNVDGLTRATTGLYDVDEVTNIPFRLSRNGWIDSGILFFGRCTLGRRILAYDFAASSGFPWSFSFLHFFLPFIFSRFSSFISLHFVFALPIGTRYAAYRGLVVIPVWQLSLACDSITNKYSTNFQENPSLQFHY